MKHSVSLREYILLLCEDILTEKSLFFCHYLFYVLDDLLLATIG